MFFFFRHKVDVNDCLCAANIGICIGTCVANFLNRNKDDTNTPNSNNAPSASLTDIEKCQTIEEATLKSSICTEENLQKKDGQNEYDVCNLTKKVDIQHITANNYAHVKLNKEDAAHGPTDKRNIC